MKHEKQSKDIGIEPLSRVCVPESERKMQPKNQIHWRKGRYECIHSIMWVSMQLQQLLFTASSWWESPGLLISPRFISHSFCALRDICASTRPHGILSLCDVFVSLNSWTCRVHVFSCSVTLLCIPFFAANLPSDTLIIFDTMRVYNIYLEPLFSSSARQALLTYIWLSQIATSAPNIARECS